MNLVEQVARMIDAEGAYGVFYDNTRADASPCEPTVRQRYFQAYYECKAIELLKLLAGQTPAKIKRDLVEFEKEGWKRLGVPLEKLPEADKIIEGKYA